MPPLLKRVSLDYYCVLGILGDDEGKKEREIRLKEARTRASGNFGR